MKFFSVELHRLEHCLLAADSVNVGSTPEGLPRCCRAPLPLDNQLNFGDTE